MKAAIASAVSLAAIGIAAAGYFCVHEQYCLLFAVRTTKDSSADQHHEPDQGRPMVPSVLSLQQGRDGQLEILSPENAGPLAFHQPSDDLAFMDARYSADGQSVSFRMRRKGNRGSELFLLDVDDTDNLVQLSDTKFSGGEVIEYAFAPDGSTVTWVANQQSYGRRDLYLSWIEPWGKTLKINPDVPTGHHVYEFVYSGSSQRILWRADLREEGVAELYLTDITRPLERILLNAPLKPEQDVAEFRFIDEDSVAYRTSWLGRGPYTEWYMDIWQPGVATIVPAHRRNK